MQKSLTRIIGEGTFWTTGGTFFVKIVSLVTIFITLRTLSVYEYGVAELVIAAVGLFSIFQLPGLTSVVVADMGIEKGNGNIGRAKGIFWSYVKLSAVMAFIATAIVFFGAEVISSFYPEHIGGYFRILAFLFPLSVVGAAYGALFTVTFRYLDQSLSTFLQEFFKLVVLSACFFIFGLKIEAVLFGMVGGQLFTFLVQFPAARRAYISLGGGRPQPFSMWQTIYKHGKWSIFSSYLGSLGNTTRTYLVKLFLGTEAVALFAVASGLVGHTSALVPIGNVVTPIIPQYIAHKERLLRIITKAIKYQVTAVVFLVLFASFVFPPIIVWLFPKYEVAMPIYRILAWGLVPAGFVTVFTAIFFAFQAQRDLFFASIFKFVNNVIFLSLFATLFGLSGVAWASIFVTIIYVFERYRRVQKLVPGYRIRLGDFLSFDELDRVILGKIQTFLKSKVPFST